MGMPVATSSSGRSRISYRSSSRRKGRWSHLRREAPEAESQHAGVALAQKLPLPLRVHYVGGNQPDRRCRLQILDRFDDSRSIEHHVRVEHEVVLAGRGPDAQAVAATKAHVALPPDHQRVQPCRPVGYPVHEAVESRLVPGAIIHQYDPNRVNDASTAGGLQGAAQRSQGRMEQLEVRLEYDDRCGQRR